MEQLGIVRASIIVFLIGSVTLSLEIIGIRILAPLVGTTIHAWTSIIGVVLIGISIGYIYGGKLADKVRTTKTLSHLLLLSTLLVLLIIPIKSAIYHIPVGASLAIYSLLLSLILFLLPTIALSSVTTYTIRFTLHGIETLGSVAGRLYGINTLGNIVGVFGTSFGLIPIMGTNQILISYGAILLLSAFIARIPIRQIKVSRDQ